MAENETTTEETPSNFEPDRIMKKLRLTLVFAFFQMVICIGITFLPYLIFGHGYFSIAISNAMKFPRQADIGISTQTDSFFYRTWDFLWPIPTAWFIAVFVTVVYRWWQVKSERSGLWLTI